MAIFKYFTHEEHAKALINKGLILLRPLSYFHAIEDDEVRGDARDGVLAYAPDNGLQITKQDGTNLVLAGWRFTSSAKDDDIFVFCASRTLSPKLAERFGQVCVEITDEEAFAGRLRARAHTTSRLDYSALTAGVVEYRAHDIEPGVDWALPERLAFIKPKSFAWQDEVRIAVPRRGAFDVENVTCRLERLDAVEPKKKSENLGFPIRIGRLADLCRLYRF